MDELLRHRIEQRVEAYKKAQERWKNSIHSWTGASEFLYTQKAAEDIKNHAVQDVTHMLDYIMELEKKIQEAEENKIISVSEEEHIQYMNALADSIEKDNN